MANFMINKLKNSLTKSKKIISSLHKKLIMNSTLQNKTFIDYHARGNGGLYGEKIIT